MLFTEYNHEDIAKKANIDTRTTKLHLDLLEEDEFGLFCDSSKKTFSTAKSLLNKDRVRGCNEKE